MEYDPSIEGFCTSDESSFACASARDRWIIILAGAIADFYETLATLKDLDARTEGEAIIEGLRTLQSEIRSDAKLTPLHDDGSAEIADYNKELGQRNPSWLNVFWLYGECFLLERLRDVFARQKTSTFQASKPAIFELVARYKMVFQSALVKGKVSEALLFQEKCEICLWGNATDLSLLTSLTYEDIQKLQGSKARKTQAKNVLIDEIPAAFDVLENARRQKGVGARVDIVLDNSGSELYVDLLLAGFLLSTGLAANVVLHPKSIPWFVSDAMPADFTNLLLALSEPERVFFNSPTPLSDDQRENLLFLSEQWHMFQKSGRLNVKEDPFWTTAGSYWRLPYMASGLFDELKESGLVIFKGDLNYRKLTGDVKWDTTTPFPTAIGPLGTSSGVRTLALRTCKADIVVGLAKGEDERLRNAQNGELPTEARRWAWTGKWAVAAFCDGKCV